MDLFWIAFVYMHSCTYKRRQNDIFFINAIIYSDTQVRSTCIIIYHIYIHVNIYLSIRIHI